MTHWVRQPTAPIDVEVLEESALAMAQSTIQNAINEAGITRADLARKMECPRSFVSRMLSGNHNLTVKTMSKSLAACGFEVRFQRVPIMWNWGTQVPNHSEETLPALAGSTMSIGEPMGVVVPASALHLGG